ncbi:hypothetical protein BB560_002941 [Smittium megazygosporum]|uniref:Cell division control protein n=1 Tax=Smittium megazygosporum TaxID=133381 RepID=A0A2T9ZDG8_9FUNG|nr:hypothetical protein BB560_002941 [Smittium megazygosporum]
MISSVNQEPFATPSLKRKRQTLMDTFLKYKGEMKSETKYSSSAMVTPKKLVASRVADSPSLKKVFSTSKNNATHNSFDEKQKQGFEKTEFKISKTDKSVEKERKSQRISSKGEDASLSNVSEMPFDSESSNNEPTERDISEQFINPFDKSKKLPIVGREHEKACILSHVENLVQKKSGGSLYISGNPGTGKTACTLDVLEDDINTIYKGNCFVVFVNCMIISNTKQFYHNIVSNLNLQKASKKKRGFDPLRSQIFKAAHTESLPSNETEYSTKSDLEKLFFNGKKSGYIVVLDELDNLVNSSFGALYSLFEWAMDKRSSLLLIGIANALDLTERLLPRLKVRNCMPELLHFKPYGVEEIVYVLKNRSAYLQASVSALAKGKKQKLGSEKERQVPRDPALELCARKIAASSGDMRKALDACKLVVENIAQGNDSQSTKKAAQSGKNLIPFPEMVKVLAGINGTSTEKMLASLNFHQKIVLVALLKFKDSVSLSNEQQKSSNKSGVPAQGSRTLLRSRSSVNNRAGSGMTINLLYEYYVFACERMSMVNILSRFEFNDLISMMESIGALSIQEPDTKTSLKRKCSSFATTKSNVSNGENNVLLSVSSKDVEKTISGIPSLANIL